MDLLKHPEAQALLEDARVSAAAVRARADHLEACAARYLPRFYREEQRQHARTLLRGKLTGLERKTTEPIATQAGEERRPLQLFVGAGGWDDQAVLGELRQHVGEELADAEAAFILDPSGFPKKGTASCGVARQWCGRLGKVENCQVGVFLAYAAPRGSALLEGRLYLTQEWAADPARRAQAHMPADVTFQEKWRLGLDLLDRARAELPGRWVVGDDELGRCSQLRAELRQRRLDYVLDVPCNTLVRERSERRPPARPGGAPRRPAFERVDQWVARQPKGRWRTVAARDGEKPARRVTLRRMNTAVADGGGARRGEGPAAREGVACHGVDQGRRRPGGGAGAAGRPPEYRRPGADLVHAEQRLRGPAGRGGAGARVAAPDRGAVRAREPGNRPGPLRGAQLGGLAPSQDAVAGGAVVPAAGAAAVGGEKPRR